MVPQVGDQLDEEKKGPSFKRPDHLTDENESEFNSQLNAMESSAREFKALVTGSDYQNWKTLWDFYLGGANHWKGYPGALTGYQQYTNNCIGRNIETAEALIEEMHISAEVQPREPMDEIQAALYEAAKTAILDREENQSAIRRASKYSRIVGCGFVKVDWDPSLCDGLGDVVYKCWPSEDVYLEPGAHDVHEARWMFAETRMSLAEAQKRWGVEDLTAAQPKDDELGKREDAGEPDESAISKWTNTVETDGSVGDSMTPLLPASGFFAGGSRKTEVIVQDWWIREDEEKFPYGRHILRVGKKIVVDEPSHFEHGQWPYARCVDQEDPKSPYGDTAARQAIELQRELNLVESLIALNIHLGTASPWILYPQSGIDPVELQKLGNQAGKVIVCDRPGFEPTRIKSQPLPGNLLDYRALLIETIDRVMRIRDVIPPGARGFPSSGEVVRELRESQFVEIRQKADNRARMMTRVVALSVALVQQYYAPDRWVRLVGPLPRALEGLTDPDTGEEIARTDEGREAYWVKMRDDGVKHGYDIRITPSERQPLSKQIQKDNILKFYQIDGGKSVDPGIVFEALLEGPEGDKLKRKIRAAREAEQQAAVAQPQGQQGVV